MKLILIGEIDNGVSHRCVYVCLYASDLGRFVTTEI